MLSLEVREFAEKLNHLSLEDKQWLLQQLMEQIYYSNIPDINQFNPLVNVKKTFNITPTAPENDYNNTAINPDEILANSNILNDPLADFIGGIERGH
jgi:hypothetical protein